MKRLRFALESPRGHILELVVRGALV